MNYDSFLINCQDDIRNKFWELFNQAEPEAKWFGNLYSNWVELISVESHVNNAVWSSYVIGEKTYAKITIPAELDDLGVIFHEIFHSAFHNSPIWKNQFNNKWGDGFCDAFRWFMETRLLKKSLWLDSFSKTENSYKILKKCEGDYNKFKDLWVYLNQNSNITFNTFFIGIPFF